MPLSAAFKPAGESQSQPPSICLQNFLACAHPIPCLQPALDNLEVLGTKMSTAAAAADADYLRRSTVRCTGSSCGILIQKDGGCNHLTCTLCGAHTCWACGQALHAAYPHYHAPGGVACPGERPSA